MKGRLFLAPSPLDVGCAPPLPALTDVLPLGAQVGLTLADHGVSVVKMA